MAQLGRGLLLLPLLLLASPVQAQTHTGGDALPWWVGTWSPIPHRCESHLLMVWSPTRIDFEGGHCLLSLQKPLAGWDGEVAMNCVGFEEEERMALWNLSPTQMLVRALPLSNEDPGQTYFRCPAGLPDSPS